MGMKPTIPDDGAVDSQIGTAYDVVKSVADNLPALLGLAADFDNLEQNFVPKTRTINGKDLSNNIVITFSDLGGKPTTLSGFGITDAQPLSNTLTDFNNQVASATTGVFKKTAANTWTFSALVAADIPNLSASKITSGTLPISLGGTGRSDGKSTALVTPVTITVGSTGKSFDGSAAVTWTLAEIGAQAVDATLTALAGVTVAANKGIYATGADAFATYDLTAFGRSLGGAADAATVNALLNVRNKTNSNLLAEIFSRMTLDLDFVSGIYKEHKDKYLYQLPLDEVISCARNSSAVATGPIELNTFDVFEPRIRYGADGKRKGLITENSATNLLKHSQYTGANGETLPSGWTMNGNTGITTTAASTRFVGAIRATQAGTVQRENYEQSVVLAPATTYTLSAYFAAGTVATGNVMVALTNAGDTPTGQIALVGSAVTAAGVYSITFTTVTGGAYFIRVGLGVSGDATGTVIHETPQLEVGPAPTSYIPTTTGASTRLSDDIRSIKANYAQKRGMLYFEGVVVASGLSTDVDGLVCINSNTSSNFMHISYNKQSGTVLASLPPLATLRNDAYTIGQPIKAAVCYNAETSKIIGAINGVVTETTVTIADSFWNALQFMNIGSYYQQNNRRSNSETKRICYSNAVFTAAELALLTE